MTAAEIVARWESRERPLFKGCLIDTKGPPGPDGRPCCCAQGDILRCAGVTDDELREMEQRDADRRVAEELGISVAHAVLLRTVNDKTDGAPQAALKASGLRTILGPNWRLVLAFFRHLDAMTADQWASVRCAGASAWESAGARARAWASARASARASAWASAGESAGASAGASAGESAGEGAGASAGASERESAGEGAGELVVIDVLKTPPYFLPFFFPDVAAWVKANKDYRDPGIIEDAG